jgi:IMP dehydrogenase
VPQITATQNVSKALSRYKGPLGPTPSVITDGGMRTSGDMIKALMAGADAVMHGRLFAECIEAPNDGEIYGLASDRVSGSGATEGETRVLADEQPYVSKRVENWAEGIRSGVSYCGGYNIQEAQERAEFIRVTPNTVEKNGVH